MIRRWIKNIAWLLNHPPISLTKDDTVKTCFFCKKSSEEVFTWTFGNRTICIDCQWKVYAKVLGK
jgi:hypothetical protein